MSSVVTAMPHSAPSSNRPRNATSPAQGSGFRVQGAGCRVQVVGLRVQGAGFRVQGAGFRVQAATDRGTRHLHLRFLMSEVTL